MKAHLAGTLGHRTLCNVNPRRWEGNALVASEHLVVDVATFEKTPAIDRCGRCRVKQRADARKS